jgi:VWFA-related protein
MPRLNPALPLLLAAAMRVSGQEPVIRIDVNLVQVDAVVTDSANKHIGNQKAGDFEILQDGKPQTITNFSYIAPDEPPVTAGVATVGRKGKNSLDTILPRYAGTPLNAGEVHRTMALVVDDLGLSADSMSHVRDALRKFVAGGMRQGDMVAIIRTSAGTGALQQFTTDKTVLNAAIDRIKFVLGRVGVSSFAPVLAQSPEEEKVAAAEEALDQFRSGTLMAGTLGALRYVIEGMREMPGRKSIVLFSESLATPDPGLRGLTDAANRASVVIDTIDPRGLQTFMDVRDVKPTATPTRLKPSAQSKRESDMADSQLGLVALARDTGGLFVKDNNLIDQALNEVVADAEGYYLIGYRPDASTFDTKTGAPLYHKVQVRLKVAGLRVRSRSGFFGGSDTVQDKPVSSRATLQHALNSPFASSDVRVQLTTLFNQTRDKRSNLSALLHIDARDLSFTAQPDGSRHANFEVAAELFGVKGEHVDRSDRVFNVDLKPDQYAAALATGVVYVVNQPVRNSGIYQMRIALRDQSSERLGTANQFIDVPDLTKGLLALSSILLRRDAHGATDADRAEGQLSDSDPATAAALRAFKPGDALSYDYLVFNAKSGGARRADLEVQTRLFRSGKLVYTGRPMVPELAGDPASGRLQAGGHMTLAAGITPGDYVMQLLVTNKLAKERYRSASQAIDFEVVQ